MAYADYDFYTGDYGGDMPGEAFAVWAARSSDAIDRATLDRAQAAPAAMQRRLQLCCCALADALCAANAVAEATAGGTLTGEDVEGYRKSYAPGAKAEKPAQLAHSLCAEYLTYPQNLMFMGV